MKTILTPTKDQKRRKRSRPSNDESGSTGAASVAMRPLTEGKKKDACNPSRLSNKGFPSPYRADLGLARKKFFSGKDSTKEKKTAEKNTKEKDVANSEKQACVRSRGWRQRKRAYHKTPKYVDPIPTPSTRKEKKK